MPKLKSRYIPTDEELAHDQRVADAKRDAKAEKILGFNPFAIGKQLEQWMKGCQWHGRELPGKLKRAGFNLPMLVVHLEAMAKRLEQAPVQIKVSHEKLIAPTLEHLLAHNAGLRSHRCVIQQALCVAFAAGRRSK